MVTEKPHFSIQWHITTNCSNRCKHCYMFDSSTFENESKNILVLDDLFMILDSIDDFGEKWGAYIKSFAITGGDPLLRSDWKDFLYELKMRKKNISLMGNPETLTEDNVKSLSNFEISSFQMSLDGLEPTHDKLRSKGSFKRTIKKLKILDYYGIHSNIMFTLYPHNANELIPLMRYLAKETKANSFSFDIGCYVGNAVEIKNVFNKLEIKRIFSKYIEEKRHLNEEGYSIHFAEKSNFLQLSRFEKKQFYPACKSATPIISGCSVGWFCTSILSDGTVLACRRMPLKIGKMPDQSFEEIFLGSELLKKFRRSEYFDECGKCDFYKYCRGCPAYTYSITGNPFAKNPLCYRNCIHRNTNESSKTIQSPPLTTNFSEEFQFISKKFSSSLLSKNNKYIKNTIIRRIFIDLAFSLSERQSFLASPYEYLSNITHTYKEDDIVFLIHHFSRIPDTEKFDKIIDNLANLMMSKILEEIFEL